MVFRQQWLRERALMLRYTCTACFINLSEIYSTGLWKQNAYKQLARL
jgi:hypothetical protein